MAGASLSPVFAKTLSSSSLTSLSLPQFYTFSSSSSSSSLPKEKIITKIFQPIPNLKSYKENRKKGEKRGGAKIYNLETPLLQLFTSFFHIWPALQYTPFSLSFIFGQLYIPFSFFFSAGGRILCFIDLSLAKKLVCSEY